ncbi:MAG: DUF393 domain-containing protein [Verrucomicrobia bacterium]|nr:DUF393 domain-containing protein [Verrucomicrobiota bacterium]
MNRGCSEPEPPSTRGWIYFDAACRICAAGVARWGGLWAQRGFRWLPLQSPEAATRLGVSEAALGEEMRLLLPEGRVLGGAKVWAFLLRSVWWLWPLGALMAVPGLNRLSDAGYHWIARRRHCLGGSCARRPAEKRRHRTIPFVELP